MKRESAVEFLFRQYMDNKVLTLSVFEKSLEIEKNQTQMAYEQGEFDCGCSGTSEAYPVSLPGRLHYLKLYLN